MNLQVEAFLSELDAQHQYASNTQRAYESDLRQFLAHLATTVKRPLSVSDFNAKRIAGYLEAERKAGRQMNTLYRRRATLRRFGQFLRQKGLIDENPIRGGSFVIKAVDSSTQRKKQASKLSEKEICQVEDVLKVAKHPRATRDRAIFTLLLESGLSIGTVLRLDLSDLDLENRRLRIAEGGRGEVWVPLKQESASVLGEYLRQGRLELVKSGKEGALFVSQMGGRMSRQGVWQLLRNWGKEAGLKMKLSPRMLRHSAVARMVAECRPQKEIQLLLGHRNPISTRALIRRLEERRGTKS